MDPRATARAIAAGRIGFGAACLLAPRLVFGRIAREADGSLVWMLRAFGIRDVVLGAGAVHSLRTSSGPDPWVTMGAVADTADAITALTFRNELGGPKLATTLALALPAATLGWKAAADLAQGRG